MKGAPCVSHCLSAPVVTSALNVVKNPPVGGRLQKFWQIWLSHGSNPRVVSILKEGYSLSSIKVTSDIQWLCKSSQASERILAGLNPKTGGGKGSSSLISGLLQPVISGAKAQQQVEAHSRPKSAEFVPSVSPLQDGNPRDHQILPSTRGVGHFAGFQRRLLSCSNKSKVAEVLTIPSQQSDISIHCSSFWPVDGSVGVRQGSQVDGSGAGYPNPPVSRRLVTESPMPGNVPTTYPDPLGPMSRSRVGSRSLQVGTGSTTGFQLCRLSFRPLSRSGQTHSGEVDTSDTENQLSFGTEDLLGQSVHVPNRTSDSHRKASSVGTLAHEAYSMAFKEALGCPRSPGKDHSPARSSEVVVGLKQGSERSTFTPLTTRPPTVYRRLKRRLGRTQWHLKKHWDVPEALEKIIPLPGHLRWWLDSNKVLKGQPLHPLRHALQLFTDASNEGWGAHLGDCTAKGLWSKPEGDFHINLLELKAVLLALKHFEHLCWNQTILVCTDNTTVVSYINKEGGMKSGSLCALLWRLLLWCNQRQIVLPARHIPGHLNVIADKLSKHKQVIQTEWWSFQRFSTYSAGGEMRRCVDSSVGEPGRLCLSSGSNSGTGGHQTVGPRMSPNHPNCAGMAQHAMVLGSSQHASSNSPLTSPSGEFAHSTVQVSARTEISTT